MSADIELFRSFVAVAEEGHVGRAAQRLFISQPALTKRIRRLEAFVGAPLVRTAGRGIELTEAGRVLAGDSARIVDSVDAAVARVRKVARSQTDQVLIGFVAPMPHELTTDILREATLHDGWEVGLRSLPWSEQISAVVAGDVDISLARGPIEGLPEATTSAERIHQELLFSEPRVAALAADHRLAGADQLSLADVADEPIVVSDVNADFWAANPRPDGRAAVLGPTASSVVEMLEIVASGRAMILPAASLGRYYSRPDIVYVPMVDLEPSTVYLVCPARDRSPALARVHDLIRNSAAELRG